MNINDVQRLVLYVIGDWVRRERTPIPQRTIVKLVVIEKPIPQSTVKAAVRVLVKKGYIRKAQTYTSGVSYVQLRTL